MPDTSERVFTESDVLRLLRQVENEERERVRQPGRRYADPVRARLDLIESLRQRILGEK
jgi:hypothetical protein